MKRHDDMQGLSVGKSFSLCSPYFTQATHDSTPQEHPTPQPQGQRTCKHTLAPLTVLTLPPVPVAVCEAILRGRASTEAEVIAEGTGLVTSHSERTLRPPQPSCALFPDWGQWCHACAIKAMSGTLCCVMLSYSLCSLMPTTRRRHMPLCWATDSLLYATYLLTSSFT